MPQNPLPQEWVASPFRTSSPSCIPQPTSTICMLHPETKSGTTTLSEFLSGPSSPLSTCISLPLLPLDSRFLEVPEKDTTIGQIHQVNMLHALSITPSCMPYRELQSGTITHPEILPSTSSPRNASVNLHEWHHYPRLSKTPEKSQ